MTTVRPRLLPLLTLMAAVLLAGCTRRFFRERADADVNKLLTEKNVFEPWKIEDWHVYPDERARFADPTNPDRPPMPPDDPAARALSPNPQKPGKAGIGLIEGTGYLELLSAWDAMNRAELPPALPPVAGNSASPYATPATAPGPANHDFLIKVEQACELGLINSREYQDQRENLYIAALPVSLQRFSFAAQFLATANSAYETTGPLTPLGERQRFVGDATTGFNKLFPTGALLIYRLANQYVFELINGKPQVSVTSLTLDLTQPLLSGGGLAVNLEPLTQSERNLLYQIRTYARFRKQYYVNVAAGSTIFSNLVVDPTLGGLTTGVSTTRGGYLPAVQQLAFLEVDRQNVESFKEFLKQFVAFAEGGQVSDQQVGQIKQSLLNGESTVLRDELSYRTALDSLKIQLGLSPEIGLEVDQTPLKPIKDQLSRYEQVIDQFKAIQVRVAGYGGIDEAGQLRERLKKELTESDFVRGTRFRERILSEWATWERVRLTDDELRKRLAEMRERRRRILAEQTETEMKIGQREKSKEPIPPDLMAQLARLTEQLKAIERELTLGELEDTLRRYEAQPWKNLPKNPADKPGEWEQRVGFLQQQRFHAVESTFELVLVEPRNERSSTLGNTWPDLPPVVIDGVDIVGAPLQTAYSLSARTALTNRLDLMNARAQLVDSWRQIAVNANSLLGVLNVGYHLDTSTPAGQAKPLDFSTNRATQRVTVNAELPLVRRLERNNYRIALINYQRERRLLQSTEDQVLSQLRSDLRQLRLQAENYRIQQQLVDLAYNQVEQALENFNQPQGAGAATSVSAVTFTNNLIGAQRGLVGAQQAMYQVWITYLTERMNVFLDLEMMPLDARGVWIDEYATRERESVSGPNQLPGNGERLPPPRPDGGLRSPYTPEKQP
jgi:outer membrane protein TolC